MPIVIYDKDLREQAEAVADALRKKSSKNPVITPVRLVSSAHLKVWNSTVSSLLVTLEGALATTQITGIAPEKIFMEMLILSERLLLMTLQRLLCLKVLLKESPAIAQIGLQITDSLLLTTLVTALANAQLIRMDCIFQSSDLTGIILAFNEENFRDAIAHLEETVPPLNG